MGVPLPPPASVVVTPVVMTTDRTRFPEKSVTYKAGGEDTALNARPWGWPKLAPTPVPSVEAPAPLPTSVMTVRLGETLRMRLFPRSAINKNWEARSKAVALGLLKAARVPWASVKEAALLPTRVVEFHRQV